MTHELQLVMERNDWRAHDRENHLQQYARTIGDHATWQTTTGNRKGGPCDHQKSTLVEERKGGSGRDRRIQAIELCSWCNLEAKNRTDRGGDGEGLLCKILCQHTSNMGRARH